MPRKTNARPHVSTIATLFEDIGFSPEQSAVLRLKTTLHIEIMKVVEKRKLSQKEIAKILDMQQPHVSKLLKGDLERTTADRLTKYLRMLGREVKVTTRAAKTQETEVA
jgi:predicted XRE-type DNA-binding protein